MRIATTLLAVSALGATASLRAAGPVANGGFEKVKQGQPVGWGTPWRKPSAFQWAATTADRYGGTRCLEIRLADHPGKAGYIEVVSDAFAADGGRLHRLFGWMRSVGWSGKGNIYSRTHLHWYDSRGKGLGTRDLTWLEIPYQSSPVWRPVELVVPAPAEARTARIAVRVHCYDPSKEKAPVLYVDDLSVTAFDVPPAPSHARKWAYAARQYGVRAERVPDPDSHARGALYAKVGRDPVGTKISGPMIPHQGPGLYRVTYRLKVADHTRPDPVCMILVASNGVLNAHTMRGRTLHGTDFRRPGHYEEFSLDFVRPPTGGMQYLCNWHGKQDLWIDTFVVTELRRLPDRELVSFYGQAPGGVARCDPKGELYVLRGPHFPLYRLGELAKVLGTRVGRVGHLATPGGNSALQPPFPDDPAKLAGVRAVVLADLDAEALGLYGRDSLRRFVEAGGTLVVLGGWVSYGQAKMQGTFIEDMLPVTSPGPFDRRRCDPPAEIRPARGAVGVDKLAWNERPVCLWIHELKAKPGARVLATAGGRPFLVMGRHGTGRVIACAGTVLGRTPAGACAFWTWRDWPRLLGATMTVHPMPR